MANVGDVYEGKVKSVKDFGFFVSITDGHQSRDGLLHKSEVKGKLNVGDSVAVVVKEIKAGNKISFSLSGKPIQKDTSDDVTDTPGTLDWKMLSKSFYRDNEKEVLREELFTDFAHSLAARCGKQLTTNALRNFYDAVKAIENPVLQAGGLAKQRAEFAKQKPFVKLLAATVAHKAKPNNLPDDFVRFLHKGIEMSNDLEEFKGFVLTFEAVAGWHAKYR